MDIRRIPARSHALANVLLVLTVVPAWAVAGQHKQFRKREPEGFPFHLSHGVLVEIKGRIGNEGNLVFALDTGTTGTVVNRRVADQMHLSCQPGSTSINFNRPLTMERCILPDIEIGTFRVKGLPVYVASLTRLSTLLDGADALIGLDLLGASRFTIDYAVHEVTFDSMKRPPAPPAKDPDDPLCMTAVIQVQGHPLRLIVDTGVQGILLYEDRLRKRLPHLRVLGAPEKVNIGKDLPAKRATLPGVRLGGHETNFAVFLISGPPKKILPGIDGFLGVSELRARRLTLDFIAKTLTWEH